MGETQIQTLPTMVTLTAAETADTWKPGVVDSEVKVPESKVERDVVLNEKAGLLENDHSLPTSPVGGIGKLWYSLTAALSWFWILIPRQGRPAKPKAPHQLHPMAYLDALRGYFALMIFTRHFMAPEWRWIPSWIIATPGLQFPFRGAPTALSVFFWISGYVITFKSVGLIQAKQYDKLFNVLSSAIFRRYVRLFTPVLGTTLVTLVLIKMGVVLPSGQKARDLANSNTVTYFIRDAINSLDVTKPVAGWRIDPHTPGSQLLDHFWSIRTEFRSSMILYLFCAGTSKMTTKHRKLLIWLCIPVLTYWQANWSALALLGMWFGERRRERAREQEGEALPTVSPSTKSSQEVPFKHHENSDAELANQTPSAWHVLLQLGSNVSRAMSTIARIFSRIRLPPKLRQPALIALFLYSFVVMYSPYENQTSPLFAHRVLRTVTPKHWAPTMKIYFQTMVGSLMMLYPLDLIPTLQRPLLTPFSQYLGELSFGIYAMQYTVGWTVHKRLIGFLVQHYGKNDFDHFWTLTPVFLTTTIVLLWAADLFRRCDVQVVTLCQYLEKRFCES